ncbi:MAG: hypothetical protein JW722_00070 [Demequinaceae bacterium]|nr:hypothetical protein [Demequinaceae bacterium]
MTATPTTPYRHFRTAVYCTVGDVLHMEDHSWRDRALTHLRRSLHVDKVYLESFRSMETASRETLIEARDFFVSEGIEVAGGITTSLATTPEWDFLSLCYSREEHRTILRDVAALTASVFDEIILDDFFFTNCTCAACVDARGDQTWAEFRLAQMDEVARALVVEPAKEVNPACRVVVKYPNWYEHFDGAGYNLDSGRTVFDGVYTGTETRDAVYTAQHLPPYLGHGILRYYENIHPGRNGGGWVDPFQAGNLDRYGQQLRLTLLGGAEEITLFCLGVIVDWSTEFDDSPTSAGAFVPVAGTVFDTCDAVLGELGTPVGVAAYRPLRAKGEPLLHQYLGTVGVPVEMTPEFPTDAPVVLLTEGAAADDDLVAKIEARLAAGGRVVVTSGLARALQGRGQAGKRLDRIAAFDCTDRKVLTDTFTDFADVYRSAEPILMPQISPATNGISEELTCLKGENGFPLLLRAIVGPGLLYVLAVPDVPTDLYHLPREIVTHLRRVLSTGLPLHVAGAPKVGVFVYDNDTCVVESFLPHRTRAEVVVHRVDATLTDLASGKVLTGASTGGGVDGGPGETRIPLDLYPNSFRAFRIGPAN